MNETYFLDTDRDGHWYVVPSSLEKQWQVWNNLDLENEEAWEQPQGILRVGGWQGLVRFKSFEIK